MRTTSRLLQYTSGITLFTRQNCSLCEKAKAVLAAVGAKRSYWYEEIDVMNPGQEAWKVYEFDTPVIHVYALSTAVDRAGRQTIAEECGKLMHRFSEDQVLKLLDKAEST